MLSLLAHLFPIGLLECPDHLLHELTICAVSNHSSPQIPYAHNTSYVFYHLCISNVEEAAFFFTIFIAPRDLSSLRWHEFAQNFQHRGYSFCFFDSTKRKQLVRLFWQVLVPDFSWNTQKNAASVAFSSDATWYHACGRMEWVKPKCFEGCNVSSLLISHTISLSCHARSCPWGPCVDSLTSLLEIPSEIKHPFARSVQIGQGVLTPRLAESVQLLYVLFGQSRYLCFLGAFHLQRNRRWTNCKSAKPCWHRAMDRQAGRFWKAQP